MHPLQKISADSRRSRHEKGIHMTVRVGGGREGGRRVPAQSSAQYRVRGLGRSPRVCTRRCRVSGIWVPVCLQAIDSASRSLLRQTDASTHAPARARAHPQLVIRLVARVRREDGSGRAVRARAQAAAARARAGGDTLPQEQPPAQARPHRRRRRQGRHGRRFRWRQRQRRRPLSVSAATPA
jgi:hypothetical protein